MNKEKFRIEVYEKETGRRVECDHVIDPPMAGWSKNLCWCDLQGFALDEEGSLYVLDECGAWALCPSGLYFVRVYFGEQFFEFEPNN